MVMSPSRVDELTTGYEKTTSGLFVHKGALHAGALRASGPVGLFGNGTGPGVVIQYSPPDTGYVQAYDYSTATWKDLIVQGRNVSIIPSGGTLILPANSVGSAQIADGAVATADIAPNAVQQQIASVATSGPWSTTNIGWVETVANCTGVSGGGLLRIEGTIGLYHSAAGVGIYIGWGVDGAVGHGTNYFVTATAGWAQSFSFVDYATSAAGSHRWAIFVYNSSGTLTLQGATNAMLFVTEQKR